MGSLYEPQLGGGITMRGIRLTEDAKVSHEPAKEPQKRKGGKKSATAQGAP